MAQQQPAVAAESRHDTLSIKTSHSSQHNKNDSSIEETIMAVSSSSDHQDLSEKGLNPQPGTTATSTAVKDTEEPPILTSSHDEPPEDEGYTPHPEDILPNAKRNRWLFLLWLLRYITIICVIGVALAVPVILYRDDNAYNENKTAEAQAKNNLISNLFAWFLFTWVGACILDVIAMLMPYIYRIVIGYLNPAHKKYWKVLRTLRKPITVLAFVAFAYIGFDAFIAENDDLAINNIPNKDPNEVYWDDVINFLLQPFTFWAAAYFLEKIVILYIALHYHYRAEETRIKQSKEMHTALVTLYEASLYLQPFGKPCFKEEDTIIRNATGTGQDSMRLSASKFLHRVGIHDYQIVHFFGSLRFQTHKTHWVKPNAPYAIVERCLTHPKSAAALAKRIWLSLAAKGNDTLTAADIAEVLGPYRKEEATRCFTTLDENESDSLHLSDFISTVVEAGRSRRAIYQGMSDMDHCINTFDWVTLLMLATVMTFWILLVFVPTLKDLQNTAAALAIGLSFALGRSFHKYLLGVVLVFFEHPFDIGDRVTIYDKRDSSGVSCYVTRQSLLYTAFRRVDNGTTLQLTNLVLDTRRIENLSRSTANTESRSIFVDFKTSFAEITALQHELEAFLVDKENCRDFYPELQLDVVNIFEMNKLELKVRVRHKSNWGDERLRARRSSKFVCALVAAIRKLGVKKPGWLKLGDGERPVHQVNLPAPGSGSGSASGSSAAGDELGGELDEEEVERRRKAKEDEEAEEERKKAEKLEVEEAARRELSLVPSLRRVGGGGSGGGTASGAQIRDYARGGGGDGGLEEMTGLRTRTAGGRGTGAEMMFYTGGGR